MNTPESLKNTGNEFFNKGDYESAIKYYKQAIEQNPHYIDAWNNLGFTYIKLGKIDEARVCNSKVQALKSQQNAINSNPSIDPPSSSSDSVPFENTCSTIAEKNEQKQSESPNEGNTIKKVENCKLLDFEDDGELISKYKCYAILTNQQLAIFNSEDRKGFEIPYNSIEELSQNDTLGSLGIDITFTPMMGCTRNIELVLIEGMFSKNRVAERNELFSLIEEYRKQAPPIDWEGMERGMELLESGDMSVIPPIPAEKLPIILKKNEICYSLISNGVEYLEERAVRDTSGGFTSMRIPIGKGFSINTGRFGAESRSHDELTRIDVGNLIVTNKRVIFDGERKNVVIPLNKIMAVTAYKDGIGIDREDRKKTVIFAGGFNGTLIKSVVQGAIKNIE